MKLDGAINSDLRMAGEGAKSLEAAGYSGAWSVETQHDPFLPLTLAAEHTSTLEIGTSIAVAFARNPMLLANLGYDLNAYSEGRMMMGLGSQIKPHITKRFSMEWSRPAAGGPAGGTLQSVEPPSGTRVERSTPSLPLLPAARHSLGVVVGGLAIALP